MYDTLYEMNTIPYMCSIFTTYSRQYVTQMLQHNACTHTYIYIYVYIDVVVLFNI